MIIIDYITIYAIISLIHFLGICREGRKQNLPIQKWDYKDYLLNLGLAIAFWIDYIMMISPFVVKVFKNIGQWFTKERSFKLPERKIKRK